MRYTYSKKEAETRSPTHLQSIVAAAARYAEGVIPYADFTFLRDNPYLRDGEHYFCLDYEFALGKLESGVFYRVLDNFEPHRKDPYLSFWGPVFEDYLAWLFESYVPPNTTPTIRRPNTQTVPKCAMPSSCAWYGNPD